MRRSLVSPGRGALKIERRHAKALKVPLVGPLSVEHDFLMRFHTADDLRRWAKFVLDWLPDFPYNLPWDTRVRLEELLQVHQHRWDRGAHGLGVKAWFCRGMVEGVSCTAAKFLEVGPRLLEAFPLIHMVDIYGIRGRGAKLAASRELSAARSLQLKERIGDDGERIIRSPHLTRVEKLWVALPRPIDLAWLSDMPVARRLRVLDLSGSKLTADVLGLFGQTDATSGLETLVLNSTGMDDEMARRLSEVTTFRNLKRLSVSGNRSLGTAGITAILQAEFAPRLEALEFAHDRLDASRIKRLIESIVSADVTGSDRVHRPAISEHTCRGSIQ